MNSRPRIAISSAPLTGRGMVISAATALGSNASTISIAPITSPTRRAATRVKLSSEIVAGRYEMAGKVPAIPDRNTARPPTPTVRCTPRKSTARAVR